MRIALLLLAAAAVLTLACQQKAGSDCVEGAGITPICGFLAPEDLEVVPGGDALIVGGFSLDNENGDLRALYLADHSIETIYTPGVSQPLSREAWGDPACPGPPKGFAAHGIHLSRNDRGSLTLLVVNHTGREAIEWFEVTQDGGRIRAAWQGCVVIDDELWINDIAMLPDGGFVASHMMPREIAATLFDRAPNDQNATGYVVEWQRDGGWKKLEGTEGALPNGIQVSAEGDVVYNNHYLANQVVAYERASGKRLWVAPTSGAPDNTSITPDGKLLVATHHASLRSIRDDCMLQMAPFCGLGFALSHIDPKDGSVKKIFESEGPPFGGATVAVETSGAIYMGAFAGDRVGRIPAPHSR